MICILCLSTSDQIMEIFDEKGLRLNVNKIVTMHFWLQPNADDVNSKVICCSCWNALESFHNFYQKVEEAHSAIGNIIPITKDELKGEPVSCVPPETHYLFENFKTEILEDCQELDSKTTDVPLDPIERTDVLLQHIKSDSESEIPLAKIIQRKTRQAPVGKVDSNSVEKKKTKKKKEIEVTDDNNDIEDEWPLSSFFHESEKRVSCQKLDEFIKQNMELSCYSCHVPLATFHILQEHSQLVHNERGYVVCCGKNFDKRGSLVDHILVHKFPDYFKCEKCDRVLNCRKNLKEHMKIHDKKLIFSCDKCDKSFHRKLLLDRHMGTHVTEPSFKCNDCDKLFVSKFSLGQHVYGVHKGGYSKICEQCGKKIRDHGTFLRHLREHNNEPKPLFECDICGVKLASKHGLGVHKKSQHLESKIDHVCTVCGVIKASIFALRRHTLYMHKYERSYACPMCNKAFKRPITLKVSN